MTILDISIDFMKDWNLPLSRKVEEKINEMPVKTFELVNGFQ